MHEHTGPSWQKYVASGQVFGRPDQIRGPDGRYLPRSTVQAAADSPSQPHAQCTDSSLGRTQPGAPGTSTGSQVRT